MSDWIVHLKTCLLSAMTNKLILLGLGGAAGTILRYAIGKWFNEQPWTRGLPWGTFVINVTGSFILGAAAVMILEHLPPGKQGWYLLIGTGFCGGYTTFSTFELETFRLVRDGSWAMAVANVVGSVLVGFLGLVLAVALVNGLFPRR